MLPKSGGWKFLGMFSCSNSGNWLLHLPHLARTSPSIDSSQSFPWQISWSICFPTRTTGAISPRGSKIELIVASIPLRVHGLSFNSILNLNASDSMHHSTPKALSIGNLSLPRSRPLISLALSSAGTDIITFLLLLTNFVSLNPPFAHISLTACTSSTASFSVGTELRASST